MVRDAEQTRRRILDAAISVFSEVGFAGARIDRIAAAAGANKRMIYAYFGDKSGLFEASLDAVIGPMIEAVPQDGSWEQYAGALFDYLQSHPEALRLTAWRQLERPTGGTTLNALYRQKAQGALNRPAAPGPAAVAPFDMLILVQALTAAWWGAPRELLHTAGVDLTDSDTVAATRTALLAAVRALEHPAP